MAEPTAVDLRTIRAALDSMPPACRYHGTNLEGTSRYREECCDTGRPSLLRKRALEALERMERVANPPPEPPCRCGRTEVWHDDDQCRICPGDEERTWKHPYTPDVG